MAVFLINICKFNGCGITFPSLTDLIQHIEDTHIDYDPKVVEQKEATQPACLPLSYVLRFISENVPKENPYLSAAGGVGNSGVELKRKLAIKHHSYSISSSNRSNTPTGSEMDEDDMPATDSEDSNDSWTTEEFSSEFIMRYGARHSGVGANGMGNHEKPFACPVPGCKKRYKNVNGIKYHSKNGHKKDGKVRKGYKCHCGKSYKTATSLKNHAMSTHNTSPTEIQMMTAQHQLVGNISPSQSLGSLSPSSMSNMSSNSNNNNVNILNGNAVLQQLTNNLGLISTNNNAACPPLSNSLSLQHLNITACNNNNSNNMINNNNDNEHDNDNNANNNDINNNNNNNNSNNINDNNNNQNNSNAAVTTAGEEFSSTAIATATAGGKINAVPTPGFTPCPIHHNWRQNNFNNTAAMFSNPVLTPLTTVPTTAAATTSPMRTLIVKSMMPTNINPPTRSSFQPIQTVLSTTMKISNTTETINAVNRISPTFIEHKYSANTFKEKLLANLRNNNRNLNRIDGDTTIIPAKVNGRSSTSAGVGEMCAIQQQLNESCKNAFHKKSII